MKKPMAYPTQDPRVIRSESARNAFERMDRAFAAFATAAEAYTSAAILGRDSHAKRQTMRDAALRYGQMRARAETVALDIADGVPVIQDKDGSA